MNMTISVVCCPYAVCIFFVFNIFCPPVQSILIKQMNELTSNYLNSLYYSYLNFIIKNKLI